jgi:hypothetical protein
MQNRITQHGQSGATNMTRIFRVCPKGRNAFEVLTEDDELLGSSSDEVKAIWSAVLAADLMSERGYCVRVLVKRGDAFLEEYVATPHPDFESTSRVA